MNRREMLGTVGLATAGVLASGGLASRAQAGEAGAAKAGGAALPGYSEAEQTYVQAPLPYAFDALEPYIDEETMRLHYTKHAAGYVAGLNQALAELKKARDAGDYKYIQYWSRKVSFNGGGHTLHTIFWSNMASPDNGGGGEPTGKLREMINTQFGSFDQFKAQFSAAATAVEGSGWGICGVDHMSGNLLIFEGENQQKLTTWAVTPVLVLDVWEHAYYLKYQNRRGEYVKNWWNVVNWSDVSERVNKLV